MKRKATNRFWRGQKNIFCLICGFLLSSLIWIFVFSILSTELALAQDEEFLTLEEEGHVVAESSVEASKLIQSQIISEISRNQILEIIGGKRFEKNKNVIESKIVRFADKFVPFVQPGRPHQMEDGSWTMRLSLKLSKASLRRMILEAGLFNDAEGPASILPLISFVDRDSGVSLHWWMGSTDSADERLLDKVSQLAHETLQSEFAQQGFHLIRPTSSRYSPVPAPYRIERLAQSDLKLLADYFKAPLVLKGDVRIRMNESKGEPLSCHVKMQVIQLGNFRTVAEVTRIIEARETESSEIDWPELVRKDMPEIAKDLANQLLDVWQRGTLNANLISLTLRGPLSPKQLNSFKASLQQELSEVKTVKERLFEPGQVRLEVDYTGDINQLIGRLKSVRLPEFELRYDEEGRNRSLAKTLVLDIRAR